MDCFANAETASSQAITQEAALAACQIPYQVQDCCAYFQGSKQFNADVSVTVHPDISAKCVTFGYH